jgi:hypothetical protein
MLERLIETFPFVGEADRAVALSALLTILDRRSMVTAPMHAFTSPTAGTGKSLLVDLCAILATGRPMPVISQGHSEEELEVKSPYPLVNVIFISLPFRARREEIGCISTQLPPPFPKKVRSPE